MAKFLVFVALNLRAAFSSPRGSSTGTIVTSHSRRANVELLLVEDDDGDARHIQRLLMPAQMVPAAEQLIEFGSIEHTRRLSETLATLAERTPDVVLLDLRLPDSDGLETLEAVVAAAPNVPVVVVTGSADAGMGPAAIQAGAQDYLKKASITDELLRRTFRYAIYRHERDREIATMNRRLMLLNRILRRDIRNDAGLIIGQGDELRDHVDTEGMALVERLLDTAQDTVERIETVTQIMDVLSSDRAVKRDPVDLLDVIEREAARLRDRHDVELTIELAGETRPEVAATAMLSVVVRQLLSNAVRHTDHATPRVDVHVEPESDVVTMTVVDDGAGISDALKANLDRLDTPTHERAAIGTGLFLVLAVLEQVDADVEFADNSPRGTVVRVTLDRV